MSLINDALRKAQKQRTGETPPLASLPSIGGESAVRIAKRTKPAGFYTLLIRLGAGVALLAIVIIGGAVLLRKKSPTPAGQQPAIIAQSAVSNATEPAASASTANSFVVPVVLPPQPVAPPKIEAPAPKAEAPKPVATAATPVPPKPEPVKPAAAPVKLEPRAMNFIEALHVAGIRASATDSKVLMNDRVYRIGDTVEHEMGLKLIGITSSSLTFEDERGGRYTRNF